MPLLSEPPSDNVAVVDEFPAMSANEDTPSERTHDGGRPELDPFTINCLHGLDAFATAVAKALAKCSIIADQGYRPSRKNFEPATCGH